MAKLVPQTGRLNVSRLRAGGLRSSGVVKILATAVFICVLAVAPALGQRDARSRATDPPPPPRPEQGYKPWPWLVAFILLGLAWYPAFKNSKRELSE